MRDFFAPTSSADPSGAGAGGAGGIIGERCSIAFSAQFIGAKFEIDEDSDLKKVISEGKGKMKPLTSVTGKHARRSDRLS